MVYFSILRLRAGVSVKPVQREWLNIGYVATPDVHGVAEALRAVANGTCCDQNGERQRAIDVVSNSMSRTSVGWAFDDLVDTISRRPLLPSVLRYGSTSCSVIREQDHQWVVVADRQHVRIAAFEVFSLRRWDSCLSHEVVGGLFSDFDAPRRCSTPTLWLPQLKI